MIEGMKASEEGTHQLILSISLSHVHKQKYIKPL